ncbi:hypothetical protein [Dactylosporangium salmoneum]|uniref:Uncharacterized protein n=1 Tax=Dactylosporangium salmoneum TaxID=53361 RepID=A0ABP5TBU3_9ACTN
MIRVDKQNLPASAAGAAKRCEEITKDLKDVYTLLLQFEQRRAFPATVNPRGETTPLDAQEQQELMILLNEGKMPTGAAAKKVKARIPSIVQRTEVVQAFTQVEPPDEQTVNGWAATWLARFQELVGLHERLVARPLQEAFAKALAARMPGLQEDVRNGHGAHLRRHYQLRATRTLRPFYDIPSARKPSWFQPDEVARWKVFETTPPQAGQHMRDVLVSDYQKILHEQRRTLLDGEHPWLVSTLWMTTDPALISAPAGLDELFKVSRDLFVSRLRTQLNTGESLRMWDERLLKAIPREKSAGTAYYFLAARAFGELLDAAMAPAVMSHKRLMLGFKSDNFDSNLYGGHGIKEALLNAQHGKCVYCESLPRSVAHGDVEHFRPKAGYDEGHGYNYGGYFWNAYTWSNLFYSCQVCNQTYKGNLFPVLPDGTGTLVRDTYNSDVSKESPVFIDAGQEDPRQFIRFNPINGEAYAYDLLRHLVEYWQTVRQAGQEMQGDLGAGHSITVTVPEVTTGVPPEQALWAEPGLIPDELNRYRAVIDPTSSSFVVTGDQQVSDDWDALMALVAPQQLRGLLTIQLLGLNRPELVRRRLAHLRSLRAMYVAARAGADGGELAQACNAAILPSAEFSSLATDALSTWAAEDARTDGPRRNWSAAYNAALAQPFEYTYETDDDLMRNDNLMYRVKADAPDVDKRREIVNVTNPKDGDKAVDEDEFTTVVNRDPDHLYLQIPEEDNKLEIVNATGRVVMTVGELRAVLPQHLHHKFKSGELYARGTFARGTQFL